MNTMLHNPTLQNALRFLPKAVTTLLVTLLAIMFAALFWQLLAPPKTIPPPPLAQKKQSGTPQRAHVNHGKVVANYHLFGTPKKKSAPPQKKQSTAPVTRLNLELFGIINHPEQESYAVIAPKKGQQKVYGVGEEPQTGVIISSISETEVILERNGILEKLRLPEAKASRYVQHANNISLPNALPAGLPNSGLRPGGSPPPPYPEGTNNALPSNDLGALRDAVSNNPDRLLEIASVSEAKDKDGNLIGFRLSPGKNRKLFRQLGLRPGDIVTSINGIQLDSPAKGIAVMGELPSASSIELVVTRGDQEVTISKSF